MNLTDFLDTCGAKAAEQVGKSFFEGKSVLITGASGLVGTGIISALRRLGVSIHAVSFSEPPEQIHTWAVRKEVELIRADLSQIKHWDLLPSADVIFHAAGYGQPRRFLENPSAALMLNTGLTHFLLEKLNPEGSFIFFSSSEVYQGLEKEYLTEADIGTTTPEHPRAVYIEGKRSGEALCHAARSTGTRASAIRLAHTFGPGTRPGDQRVINMFIEQAIRKRELVMQDAGLAVRTWGYLYDAVEIFLKIAAAGTQTVYNVSGSHRLTIRELADRVAKISGASVQLPADETPPPGAPSRVSLSMQRALEELGPFQETPFEKALEATIRYQELLYGK
jgi:UDP-glucuronate decarboxylase